MREEINKVISENLPCYRDLFGGKCEFTTGCDKCPDYFNPKQEIISKLLALMQSQVETAVRVGRQEVFDFLHKNSAAVMMNEYALKAQLEKWGIVPIDEEAR